MIVPILQSVSRDGGFGGLDDFYLHGGMLRSRPAGGCPEFGDVKSALLTPSRQTRAYSAKKYLVKGVSESEHRNARAA